MRRGGRNQGGATKDLEELERNFQEGPEDTKHYEDATDLLPPQDVVPKASKVTRRQRA